MILNRDRLAFVLGILSNSVGNKVLQVSNFVAFRVDAANRKVYLATTNFLSFMMMDFGEVGTGPLDNVPEFFLIDFKSFYTIIKNSTTPDAEIRHDGTSISVKTNGNYRFSLYQQPDDFPVADLNAEVFCEWPVPQLQSAWGKASISVSPDVTKIAYQGVNYDGSFAATDSRRLSVVNDVGKAIPSILIPPLFGDILKHCRNTVALGTSKDLSTLILSCKEIGLVASVRLIDAKFASYRTLVSKRSESEFSFGATVSKSEILGALNRLSSLTDNLYKMVTMIVVIGVKEDGQNELVLQFSVENNNAGSEPISAIEFDSVPEDSQVGDQIAKFSYQIDNLIDGIAVTDSPDSVTLAVQTDGKMWIDEDKFMYLLTSIQS